MFLVLTLLSFSYLAEGKPVSDGFEVSPMCQIRNKVESPTVPFIAFVDIITHLPVGKYKMEQHSYCGGSIIREDVVLTAAHCLRYFEEEPYAIYAAAGVLDRIKDMRKAQDIEVDHYLVHEKYTKSCTVSLYDIAMLWMTQPFILKNNVVELAVLPSKNFNINNKDGYIFGWGYTSKNEMSDKLQAAKLTTVPNAYCKKTYSELSFNNEIFCAISSNKKSIQHSGDSGGPFVIDGTLVGIISFSKKSCLIKVNETTLNPDGTKPGGYTNLVYFIDWINENL